MQTVSKAVNLLEMSNACFLKKFEKYHQLSSVQFAQRVLKVKLREQFNYFKQYEVIKLHHFLGHRCPNIQNKHLTECMHLLGCRNMMKAKIPTRLVPQKLAVNRASQQQHWFSQHRLISASKKYG